MNYIAKVVIDTKERFLIEVSNSRLKQVHHNLHKCVELKKISVKFKANIISFRTVTRHA